ncbi:hypothetical protein PMAYCL1PPCAC_04952, partial [Pristionchus mayeri]
FFFRILCNFNHMQAIPSRFLRGSFVEKFIAEAKSENVCISTLAESEKVAPKNEISLENFHKVEIFQPDFFTTTLTYLVYAIEQRLEFALCRQFSWNFNVNAVEAAVKQQIREECEHIR